MLNDATIFDVEAGKVREFARAIHLDVSELAADDGALSIPGTFLTTMNFHESAEAMAEEFGFELSRMLHGEQEYEFFGPPPVAGTRLLATSRIVDRFEKQGPRGGLMRFAVRVTEFRDGGGALVARARMTAIQTEPGA